MRWSLAVVALVTAFGAGCLGTCASTPPTWEGFIYPDATDLTVHRAVGVFSSLEDCRDAAHAALQRAHDERCIECTDEETQAATDRCDGCDDDPLRRGDYECGKNCRDDSAGRLCEATER